MVARTALDRQDAGTADYFRMYHLPVDVASLGSRRRSLKALDR